MNKFQIIFLLEAINIIKLLFFQLKVSEAGRLYQEATGSVLL